MKVEDISKNVFNGGRVPLHGVINNPDVIVSDACLQLVAAIQADGHVVGNHVIFHLVKDRKKERLISILEMISIPYSLTPCKCHAGRGVRIAFNFNHTDIHKYLTQQKYFILENLMKLSLRQRHIFLDELPWWDGSRSYGIKGKQTSYVTTCKDNAEIVQLLCHISARQGILTADTKRLGNRKDIYTVSFNHRNYTSLTSVKSVISNFVGNVYCVTVPSGWFMIRHNGLISITGNSNFMQGPKGAMEKIYSETGIEYDVSLVKKVMDIYFDLFPEIKKWHSSVLFQADKDGFIRNPFGYVHRFSKVYDWEKVGGKWQKQPGPDANRVIAFGPQSTAAGIIKEAMLRLFFERFEEAGQYLRLLVHDELFFEVPLDKLKRLDIIVKEEMERPIPQLSLPKSYGMGDCLNILTEEKVGVRWGQMK